MRFNKSMLILLSAALAQAAPQIVDPNTEPTGVAEAPDGGVGIYQGNIPFDGLTGAVSISLSRGGVVFATVNGPAITTDCSTTTKT